ncbi:NAD-dependent protein deacylase [uncultured Selenomonas sp.]|uniref:NAD-dependent protein deacylase n=1 Tax=uncultured Selenomonas sp. TaxID=159275 RepID=UPI0028DB8365|nr:NAD-dependent protein deacylase [uncultured Selenomonas sp.]
MEDEKIGMFHNLLKESSNIVFFGGAGVSTESGIPDFRSATGLYSRRLSAHVSPEELVSHTFFERCPEEFFDFYRKRLIYMEAKPNDCHKALAVLERIGKLKAVITQNIDGLHQEAGSSHVLELHGSVRRNYCMDCHALYDARFMQASEGVPHCTRCGATVKPDVVLYEESLDMDVLDAAVRAISAADMLIVGGTSLIVYPAAGLLRCFNGDRLVLINKTATQADRKATLVIHDSLGKVFREAVDGLTGS